MQTQRLIVSTHDRRFFIEKVQQLTLLGAKLADNTVPRLTTPFPFQAEFDITLASPKDIFKSELGIHALCPSAEIFTEEEMKASITEAMLKESFNASEIEKRNEILLKEFSNKAGAKKIVQLLK